MCLAVLSWVDQWKETPNKFQERVNSCRPVLEKMICLWKNLQAMTNKEYYCYARKIYFVLGLPLKNSYEKNQNWAPHKICSTCSSRLRNWLNKRSPSMPSAATMIWREHPDHCHNWCFYITKSYHFWSIDARYLIL